MAKNTTQAEQRTMTFTPEALKQVLDQAIAEALAKRDAQPKADNSAKMEALTLKAFKKAGFTDVQPRVNTLTYNKWLEQGRIVKEGEKAIKAKNLRLFHVSQTRPVTPKDKAALAEKAAAKEAKANPAKPAVTPAKGKHAPQPSAA